jgi:hypothetical protein
VVLKVGKGKEFFMLEKWKDGKKEKWKDGMKEKWKAGVVVEIEAKISKFKTTWLIIHLSL